MPSFSGTEARATMRKGNASQQPQNGQLYQSMGTNAKTTMRKGSSPQQPQKGQLSQTIGRPPVRIADGTPQSSRGKTSQESSLHKDSITSLDQFMDSSNARA
eukprot:CAMPEP_0184553052 /NCGR_PEP_ID=MMETSP0199_2-20130426/30780_1 /TAXON_ID=1112570 /ORGANISM="Thraustochytrium sp., Strain LLF1b" /LENGTH=101 /DNA_ID=CAMNT_0026948703 /DNA_START=1 /DNA_END=303 /DNA_ORIENTATION=-